MRLNKPLWTRKEVQEEEDSSTTTKVSMGHHQVIMTSYGLKGDNVYLNKHIGAHTRIQKKNSTQILTIIVLNEWWN